MPDFAAADMFFKDGVYVDLIENPERFTGYAGESAARVWKSIYEENCFNIVHRMTDGCETCNNILNTGPADQIGLATSNNPLKMAESVAEVERKFAHVPEDRDKLDALLNDLAEDPDGDGEEVCLEKRVYYRLISGNMNLISYFRQLPDLFRPGLHSSISIHICDEYFNQTTGEWVSVDIYKSLEICILLIKNICRVLISIASSHVLVHTRRDYRTYTLLTRW